MTYALWTPSLRSSHLERLAPRPGLRLLASGRHPDCDDALLARTGLQVVLGDLDALAAGLAADPPDVLEVTEPLWVAHWPEALHLADAAPSARLVTYALEVLPPADPPDAGRLRAVAFGSSAARRAYDAAYPAASWRASVHEDARERCRACFPGAARRVPAAPLVVFAAEFSERKAVDLLMAAWDAVRPAGWRLAMLGWGPRTDQVLQWGEGRPDVEVVVGAGRDRVHAALREAAVVVLPSRRVPGWREQVGLSLVEGLAHGCRALTTTETGLAEALAVAGHVVVAPDDLSALAEGLREVTAEVPDGKVLPADDRDSRRDALAWLAGCAGVGPTGEVGTVLAGDAATGPAGDAGEGQ